MSEARRLLERLADIVSDYPLNRATGSDVADAIDEARAYLAQPITKLTGEEQKWADATMDNTKAWLVPSLRAAAGRVAESRAREGKLGAALKWYANLEVHRWGPAGREPDIIFDKGGRARAALGKKV